jgi:hypothetical protein
VNAPSALSVAEFPVHTDVLEALNVTVGVALTMIVVVLESTQPLTSVPITVYVVFAVGETVTPLPVNAPGIHE